MLPTLTQVVTAKTKGHAIVNRQTELVDLVMERMQPRVNELIRVAIQEVVNAQEQSLMINLRNEVESVVRETVNRGNPDLDPWTEAQGNLDKK
jgi:hypothetical protein